MAGTQLDDLETRQNLPVTPKGELLTQTNAMQGSLVQYRNLGHIV